MLNQRHPGAARPKRSSWRRGLNGEAGRVAWPTLRQAARRDHRRPAADLALASGRRKTASAATKPSMPGFRLFAILLNAGGLAAWQAVPVVRTLPGKACLDGQRVTAASLLAGQESAAHGSNHLGLAADHPAAGARRREVRHREGGAIGPDDVVDTRTQLTIHARIHRQLDVLTDRQGPL